MECHLSPQQLLESFPLFVSDSDFSFSVVQEKGKDSGRIIAFLLELGFHTVGQVGILYKEEVRS